jgi:hypothetical protein
MFSEVKLRLSAERLREVVKYAPETGLFHWRISQGGAGAGVQAGTSREDGYRIIRIDGMRYFAHRLAWLYVHGEHPTAEIDHKNGNPSDNRIANLRPCSRAENARNVPMRRNRSGFKGVFRCRGKWKAQITVNGKKLHIGVFSTPQKAAEAYDEAARLHHGEFARTNAQIAAQRMGNTTTVRPTTNKRAGLAMYKPLHSNAQLRSGPTKALLLATSSPGQASAPRLCGIYARNQTRDTRGLAVLPDTSAFGASRYIIPEPPWKRVHPCLSEACSAQLRLLPP